MLDNTTSQTSNGCGITQSGYEIALYTLTLPLWTLVVLYLLLMIIHHIRNRQHYYLFDRCNPKNAHFRYDFHIVVGKHTLNWMRYESMLIIDLLDTQLISTMTIQIPGGTIFNDHSVFMHNHCRRNLRFVNFTIYRRAPIKDVKAIRVAHTCSNPDSRLFVYGVDLYDAINGETKFFPLNSLVKYRGTHWALNTTFEPKSELNFRKIGCDRIDPFGVSSWPSYVEIATMLAYIWSASLFFGYLIPVKNISHSVPLHALAIIFIVGSSAALISAVYLYFIKRHTTDYHYESNWWQLLKILTIFLLNAVAVVFWMTAAHQLEKCENEIQAWALSCVVAASILTLIMIFSYLIARKRKSSRDHVALVGQDATMMKTSSKQNLEFTQDTLFGTYQTKAQARSSQSKRTEATKTDEKAGKQQVKKKSEGRQRVENNQNNDDNDDNLETAFAVSPHNSKYLKTKNRNSISQYV